MTRPKTETRWHNGFVVELTGRPLYLDKALMALNAHDVLVVACAEAARRFASRMDHDSQYVLMTLNAALLLAREGVTT